VSDDFRPAPSDAEALAATLEREARTAIVMERAGQIARVEGVSLDEAHKRALHAYDAAEG
jgi:hypothetical protein